MKTVKKSISLLLTVILAFLCCAPYAAAAEIRENQTSEEEQSSQAERSVYTRYGDADADGAVTAGDARVILRIAVGLDKSPDDPVFLYACDVDYDGKLTAADARIVLRASVELEQIDDISEPHEHSWGKWAVRKKAKCDSSGLKARVCSENRMHVHYEIIPQTNHSLVKVNDSLIKDGYIYKAPFYKCSVCGKLFTTESGTTEVSPQKYIPDPVPFSSELKAKCDSICKQFNATGLQIAVIKDGYVANTYSYGTADKSTGRKVNEDTKYRAASLSKIATAIVFMALCDQGLVSETEDISTYFGYKCYNPYYPNITITPRMILTHTATLIESGGRTLTPGMLASKSSYYRTKPGTYEQYSNFGYNVLACICERVTKKPLNQLAKELLFEPLGIDAAFLAYTLKDTSNLGGLYGPEGNLTPSAMLKTRPLSLGVGLTLAAGNLTISAKDYAKILAMIMNDGVTPEGKRVLSSKSVEAMKTVRINTGVYGLGYAMRRETTVFPGKVVYAHSGSAYGMFGGYVFCPDENAGVVVFSSGCSRSRVSSTALYTVCHQLIQATYPNK
ncbi:MAG: serine hydrolase [Oscillospiraceae bacterium]|nr:serine hydrolase [Oscillospiraceae bacterium]